MDLANQRREYRYANLDLEQANKDPLPQLLSWLDQAQAAQIVDASAMTLSTVDEQGMPSSRTVLLKGIDQKGLVFYTNLASSKAKDISVNNQVCLHFAWLQQDRQVRVQGVANRLSTTQVLHYFLTRPRNSQLSAWASEQSRVLQSREVLIQQYEQMKQKFKDGKIPLPAHWGGYCVTPIRFEFWQGGNDRLHDRLVYRRQSDHAWSIERLAP
ncbi:pyridoxamine 5'-phosphate oxidase [Saccharobesus litoralis]|uniref:Pyridoxine/pyridoxamine 5'-phosphate oxidase n=1 Tax=Saccharobesus litoralis TaxID=2172099 RepID=A0A2S0VNH6_9ALTE|nr:pyridoxamine 5'-phosphate oxidase [Saccharobesus litoralis]AWB65778.1 pyridoxamine 5'-phosphate oxidase [Saccharobesus litoralis]